MFEDSNITKKMVIFVYNNKTKHVFTTNRGGVSAMFLLFVVFLVLKLTDTIDWSWVWVTAPLWIGAAIAISIALMVFLLFILFGRRK